LADYTYCPYRLAFPHLHKQKGKPLKGAKAGTAIIVFIEVPFAATTAEPHSSTAKAVPSVSTASYMLKTPDNEKPFVIGSFALL